MSPLGHVVRGWIFCCGFNMVNIRLENSMLDSRNFGLCFYQKIYFCAGFSDKNANTASVFFLGW